MNSYPPPTGAPGQAQPAQVSQPSFPTGHMHSGATGFGQPNGSPGWLPPAGGPSAAPPQGPPPVFPAPPALPARGNATVSAAAGIVGVAMVVLGLSIPFDSSNAWSVQTAWAVFAAIAALVGSSSALPGNGSTQPGKRWAVAAAGAAGVVGYWLLIVVPSVSSNAGFTLTLGTAAIAASVWLSPTRSR